MPKNLRFIPQPQLPVNQVRKCLKYCRLASFQTFLFDLSGACDALVKPSLSANASLGLWLTSLSPLSGHWF